jgi:hypothetical protein
VVLPISQILFDRDFSSLFLGRDLHTSSMFGPPSEDIMPCTLSTNYTYARESCGRVTKLESSDPADVFVTQTTTSNFFVPIMLDKNRYTHIHIYMH